MAQSIVSGCMPEDPKSGLKGAVLRIIDLRSGRISALPGSQGLWSPRWSPDGRYIAALVFPGLPKLMLCDVKTHEQSELFAVKGGGWQTWSRDSQYVYFREYGGDSATESFRRILTVPIGMSIRGQRVPRASQ